MLVLSRLTNERICLVVGETEIWLTVVEIRSGCKVRLGFDAPDNVIVLREEIIGKEIDGHEQESEAPAEASEAAEGPGNVDTGLRGYVNARRRRTYPYDSRRGGARP